MLDLIPVWVWWTLGGMFASGCITGAILGITSALRSERHGHLGFFCAEVGCMADATPEEIQWAKSKALLESIDRQIHALGPALCPLSCCNPSGLEADPAKAIAELDAEIEATFGKEAGVKP